MVSYIMLHPSNRSRKRTSAMADNSPTWAYVVRCFPLGVGLLDFKLASHPYPTPEYRKRSAQEYFEGCMECPTASISRGSLECPAPDYFERE